MNTQVNIRLPDDLLEKAQAYAEENGFGTLQEFIKETIREKVFDEPTISEKELDLVIKLAGAISKNKSLLGTREELNLKLKRGR